MPWALGAAGVAKRLVGYRRAEPPGEVRHVILRVAMPALGSRSQSFYNGIRVERLRGCISPVTPERVLDGARDCVKFVVETMRIFHFSLTVPRSLVIPLVRPSKGMVTSYE